ncbi:hypothetical protein Q7C18_02855 [Nesterenkonia sp. CL21]|uniref:hypothetical protein n=1 Tax=Nesterenkonia sp. CL21 TaxID=3064894 RepID=UPI0028793CEA|nr:hypothetical protein [Nesterenkonia sp. CL21]MDS2171627.1 hypothetical protein [Nesterenkonia sp. CL21]
MSDWKIDLGDAGTDVKGAILDRLTVRGDAGEVDYYGENLEDLAEFIAEDHAYHLRGEFTDDDLTEAIDDAHDKYMGDDIVEYYAELIEETEQPSSLAVRYSHIIAEQMAEDAETAGEVVEHGTTWFRTY